MAAPNTRARFTRIANISSVLITAANTSSQGGGTIATDIFKAFTSDVTNGSFVEKVRLIPTGTAATTTTATVCRIFLSSVTSGATTSANTFLVAEVTLPAIPADNATASVNPFDVPLGFTIPPNWTILVTNHAAPAANTAWRATAIAGDY